MLSEIQTRGVGGGTDEFIELYNPTGQDVILGVDWTIVSRAQAETADVQRWQGHGGTLPAHGFFLVGGSGYTESPARDDGLSSGISDAGRVQLVQSGNVVDAVCFAYDSATFAAVGLLMCPGSPAQNDHDDASDSDIDRSMRRVPDDCTDTGDSSVDFAPRMPSLPKSSASPPVVY